MLKVNEEEFVEKTARLVGLTFSAYLIFIQMEILDLIIPVILVSHMFASAES